MRYLVMLAVTLASGAVSAAPRTYLLPDETAAFVDGTNMDLAQGNCGACHSSDYIATQPRGLPNPQAFWNAEVVKMQKVYGAPIEDGDVAKIVGYLVQAYGK